MKKFITILFLSVFVSTTANSSDDEAFMHEMKQQDLKLRVQLQEKISQLTSNEKDKKRMMNEARKRVRLCKACHGEDGNAIVARVPSLAGQNPVYLVDQFMRFGDGRRTDATMNSLAKVIKDEDKIKLAIYFSEQAMKPAGDGKAELIERGRDRYSLLCVDCHGNDGRGNKDGYARLAGQRADYIVKILKEFKNQTGRRSNPWMSARANALSDTDIEAVAAYLANMQ